MSSVPQHQWRQSGSSDDHGTEERRMGLFIDCDNQSHRALDLIIATAAAQDNLMVRRAYADWGNSALDPWKQQCIEHAVHQIQATAYSKEKNAADMALAVDVMELYFTGRIDAVCIASSDSDFTPLVRKLREYGVYVLGVSAGASLSPAFRQACNRFALLDPNSASDDTDESASSATPQSSATSTPDWEYLMTQAYVNSITNDGWMPLTWAGTYVRKLRPDFRPQQYGFGGLLEMIESKPDLFRIDKRTPPSGGPPVYFARPSDPEAARWQSTSQRPEAT